jgi:hypothetical protein
MSNKEIIRKAIKKAVKNGWNPTTEIPKHDWPVGDMPDTEEARMWGTMTTLYETLIFSHDFAKAFWENKLNEWAYGNGYSIPNWQYHLQQLALAEDRLAYLAKFL